MELRCGVQAHCTFPITGDLDVTAELQDDEEVVDHGEDAWSEHCSEVEEMENILEDDEETQDARSGGGNRSSDDEESLRADGEMDLPTGGEEDLEEPHGVGGA